MNVRGERIIVFGDSLSHHGADAAPEIWDVDAGSNRVSGQPGDLLASMLAEQGAAAVRVNARVGRSAHNFFTREDQQALLGSDQAFAPTKVIVILGTNDVGLSMDADAEAMRKIRDFYKGLGAEVWAVGPFAYADERMNQGAIPVIDMMRGVFGSRYIDPRPITSIVGRARDGIHFGAESAKQTAEGLLPLVLNANTGKGTIAALALGFAAAIGGAMAYSWAKNNKLSIPGLSRAGDTPPTPDHRGWPAGHPLTLPNPTIEDWRRFGTRGWRATMRKAGYNVPPESAFKGSPSLQGYRVAWSSTDPTGKKVIRYVGDQSTESLATAEKWRRSFKGWNAWIEDDAGNHVPVKGALKPAKRNQFSDDLPDDKLPLWLRSGLKGLGYCDPNQSPEAFKRCTKREKRSALLGPNDMEDPLAKRQRVSKEVRLLIKDPDPAALDIAQDLALQNEIKFSELTKVTDNHGVFWIDNHEDLFKRARVSWKIDRDDGAPECRASFEIWIEGKRVGGMPEETDRVRFEEGYHGSDAYCRRTATAQAWAIAKETKQLAAKGFTIATPDIFRVLDRDNSQPEDLFGLQGPRWVNKTIAKNTSTDEAVVRRIYEAVKTAKQQKLHGGYMVDLIERSVGRKLHSNEYWVASDAKEHLEYDPPGGYQGPKPTGWAAEPPRVPYGDSKVHEAVRISQGAELHISDVVRKHARNEKITDEDRAKIARAADELEVAADRFEDAGAKVRAGTVRERARIARDGDYSLLNSYGL